MIEGHRIFVSHSSADKTLTAKVCQGLSPQGDKQWYEVLVDMERLEAGEPWPQQLHEWMARCHAGLLLLTPAAVESSWVLKEATILAWRAALEPGFNLFIQQADGVDDDLLEKHGFGPLQLGQIQRLGAPDAAGIAAEVRAKLADASAARSPFEWTVETLSVLLGRVDAETLKKVAGKLREFEPPKWSPAVDDQKRRYTETIARHLMCGNLSNYEIPARDDAASIEKTGLKGLMSDIGWELDSKTLRNILRLLAPHWTEGEAAARVGLLPSAEPRRAAAINGDDPEYTLPLYVTRAHLDDSLMYDVLKLPDANAGDLVDHYSREICEEFRRRRRRRLGHKQDPEVIAWLKRQRSDRYVILPTPPPPADVATLVGDFPTLSFVLCTGSELRIEPCPDCVDLLEPAVDPVAESRHCDDYEDCIELIERAER